MGALSPSLTCLPGFLIQLELYRRVAMVGFHMENRRRCLPAVSLLFAASSIVGDSIGYVAALKEIYVSR